RAGLVAPAHQLEEQMRSVRLQRQVAKLVDDQQLRLREAEQLLVEPLLGVCLGEACDERHGGGELHRVAGQDRLPAEGDGKVGLADAGRYWFRARSRTWWRDLASILSREARTHSRASPANGACLRRFDEADQDARSNWFRLRAARRAAPKLAAQSDKEGWPAARFLAALAEHEAADRTRRRIERHMAEARLPAGKTLATFDFDSVPMVSKAQVMALASGDVWLKTGANLLLFGPPGGGKSHLSAAVGLALVENGWRVLFARTTDLVQRLQVARRELALESALAKLDRYDLLILDDIAYVTKDQAETSVLFELIATRYERRSMLITANQPFGEWGRIFPDQAMTLAAIDRLVHHATILEMNVESYRRKAALDRKRGRGRPPAHSTPKKLEKSPD